MALIRDVSRDISFNLRLFCVPIDRSKKTVQNLTILEEMIQAKKIMSQLSWSKLRLFLQCPRCFYHEQLLAIKRPGPDADSFRLNKAVDELLKKEFDQYRKEHKPHPLMTQNGIDAVPFEHSSLEQWRTPYSKDRYDGGIRFFDRRLDVAIFGGVDDVWVNSKGELIIVEYKATSTEEPIVFNVDNQWHNEYARQISLYAWLFKKNNFTVHPTGYFIFCNGRADRPAFNQRLEFDMVLIDYQLDDSWIERALEESIECLGQPVSPEPAEDCKFCSFTSMVNYASTSRML